jgi:hypothetical protein
MLRDWDRLHHFGQIRLHQVCDIRTGPLTIQPAVVIGPLQDDRPPIVESVPSVARIAREVYIQWQFCSTRED